MIRFCSVLFLSLALAWMGGKPVYGQSGQQKESTPADSGYLGEDGSHGKPSFSPSGVEGATAPSGYSAGESADESANITVRTRSLDAGLSLSPPAAAILNCNREGDLLQAVLAGPGSFAANHELGVFYFQHNAVSHSIEFLDRAYALQPLDEDNQRWLTLAYLRTGRFTPAVALLQTSIKHNPTDAGPVLLLAGVYALMPDRAKAIAAYQTAAGLDRGEENQFAAGIGLLSLAATEEALPLFARGTAFHPASAKLWMGFGIAQNLSGRKAESAGALLRAVDLDPGYLPAQFFLASVSGSSVVVDAKIIGKMQAFVATQPASAEAHYDYGLALWKHGHLAPAEQNGVLVETQLKLAIAREPAFAAAHFQLGVVYQESGDVAQAVHELELALQLDADNAPAHYRLAQAYRHNHQLALADAELERFKRMHADLLQENDSTRAGLRVYAAVRFPGSASTSCH